MATSEWRESRNAAARARLEKSLRPGFPAHVLHHALTRPLIPPTPSRAVASYWRHHVLRADRLARALAARTGAPEGWTWQVGRGEGRPASFRVPPAPYREDAHAPGLGACRVCGGPVFRFGWHRDLAGDGAPSKRAGWHAACVIAWEFWCSPSDHLKDLKARQRHRCAVSGKRLLRGSEVDHRLPLYRVWREERDLPWPFLLSYWGAPNLQVVNRAGHLLKCREEADERAALRREALIAAPDDDLP
ncbi:hypothetical protein ASG52_01530 [Methylobacterium sp. Leaf456]|uniref:hypothetical protein n=1 Tax=Methylobacterium sp. Leaf456 TaxID=1736382 RepID=UPI0006F1E132|nr:hypothetical protein [Methylobacterium sp. Leaf456]KQT61592.1 hypothetical protein ASG52_01530 [Methylobacterium sp. Leaf456]